MWRGFLTNSCRTADHNTGKEINDGQETFLPGLGGCSRCRARGLRDHGPGRCGCGQNSVPVAGATIPVAGSDMVFPVRRFYCIGRSYRAHSIEMGSNPDREPPFFFQKPTDAIQNVTPGVVADHPYPSLTKNYHYEVARPSRTPT